MRNAAIYLHRYVGLVLAAFLVIIGLTGSVITFFYQLDEAVNPDLYKVEPVGESVPLLTLREQLSQQEPHSHVYYVHFQERADKSISFYIEPNIDPTTGEYFPLDYDEVFVNQYTGERLGERMWGDFSLERKDLIAQLYFLHYSLVLPEELGEGFMGIVALVWFFDCFVGLYLTFPPRRKGEKWFSGFWQRWKTSWKIKPGATRNRRIYDLHRAVSLWVWLMLLTVALSGFAINLPDTYERVANGFLPYTDIQHGNELEEPLLNPAVGWDDALQYGQQHMSALALSENFTVNRPTKLIYRRWLGNYFYCVHSSRDLVIYGETCVGVNGSTGELTGFEIPTGHSTGNTFTTWINALHMSMVFGLPWKIFMSILGLTVVILSITGVLIWWRKRLPASEQRRSYFSSN